jgi:hypothetical protein
LTPDTTKSILIIAKNWRTFANIRNRLNGRWQPISLTQPSPGTTESSQNGLIQQIINPKKHERSSGNMPTLNWIGKEAVVKHHKEVPFRLLESVPHLGCGTENAGGGF